MTIISESITLNAGTGSLLFSFEEPQSTVKGNCLSGNLYFLFDGPLGNAPVEK